MEEVKRKIEITQGEYEDLIEAIGSYENRARRLGYGSVADRFNVLFHRIDGQIDEQGGFEE